MSKKPCKIASWIKRQWKGIILILFGVVLLVGNICVLCYVSEANGQSAWLTLYSGWVSGIATIILGVIAVVQNKQYKEENDDNIKKQYDFELFKLIIHQREQYISRISVMLDDYVAQFDYKKLIPIIEEIGSLYHPQFEHVQTVELKAKLDFFYRELVSKKAQLVQLINTDMVLSLEKDNILENLKEYESTVLYNKSFSDNMTQAAILNLHKQIGKLYENLTESTQKYLDFIDNDLIKSITEKSTDIEYIKRRYVKQGEQNNG